MQATQDGGQSLLCSGSRDSVVPWRWQPDPGAWFDAQIDPLLEWQPNAALRLNQAALKRALADAIDARCAFLRHPCANPLTQPGRRGLAQDCQLAIWTAAHSESDCGEVTIPEPLLFWVPGGSEPLEPGVYVLSELGTRVRASIAPATPVLDPWCGCLGEPLPDSWAALDAETLERRQPELSAQVIAYFRTLTRITSLLPEVAQWITSATQVAIPLCGEPGKAFRSGSQVDLAGVIYLDLFGGPHQILEALVHESAHLHLHTAAAEGPLIDPEHAGLYHSPLRPEPRPLRGILLACHALAYICAAHVDALQAGFVGEALIQRTLTDLRQRMEEAEQTLVTHRQHLTTIGNDFLDRTREVCTYGRA